MKSNKIHERALFLSVVASLKCKNRISRAYCEKKRTNGKKHDRAVIALARRRCNVLFAMLRDGAIHQRLLCSSPESKAQTPPVVRPGVAGPDRTVMPKTRPRDFP